VPRVFELYLRRSYVGTLQSANNSVPTIFELYLYVYLGLHIFVLPDTAAYVRTLYFALPGAVPGSAVTKKCYVRCTQYIVHTEDFIHDVA